MGKSNTLRLRGARDAYRLGPPATSVEPQLAAYGTSVAAQFTFSSASPLGFAASRTVHSN